MSVQRVDAHVHFWRYFAQEYGWIDARMAELRRDFLPEHVAPELSASSVDIVVAVQARQTLEETAWLLQLAEQAPFVRGVVGWVDLQSSDVPAQLAMFPGMCGVRHIVQAEPRGFLELPAFNRGVAALTTRGLTYDLLLHAGQLREAIALVDRHPNQRFVLDHLGKPAIATGELEPWAADLRDLARRPNVWAKLSGLVTEAAWATWSRADLRPYLETAWAAFGAERLMFGSDYPVCRVAADYASVLATLTEFLLGAAPEERDRVLGANATAFYGLAATR